MPLHRLYDQATGSMNPTYLTGLQPGGAGTQVAGTQTNPGISAPRLEESTIEVLDVSAPTQIGTSGQTFSLPAPAGKLLQISPFTGIGGSRWKLNAVNNASLARGQYGIVIGAGSPQNQFYNDAGYCVTTPVGNEAAYGTKAIVMYDGPTQAFVETTVGGIAISAGMPLSADGAGNLTARSYSPAGPVPGTILATALGPVAAAVSIPVLTNVYIGGY